MLGLSTFTVEVTNISAHGFWLLLDREELLISFQDFPWFKAATIEQLADVVLPSANHLYWPRLDIDLSVESIRTPKQFPLVSSA